MRISGLEFRMTREHDDDDDDDDDVGAVSGLGVYEP